MFFRQICLNRRIKSGLILLACVTFLFSLVLLWGSAYFVSEEHRHISDVILKQNIQQIDAVLQTTDRMTYEFILENDQINRFNAYPQLKSIDEYKMKLSLDRFYDSLLNRYGDAVSVYMFAPQANRIYVNGALYPYDGFEQKDWVEQQMSAGMRESQWDYGGEMLLYEGYRSFTPHRVMVKQYVYPLTASLPMGTIKVLIDVRLLEGFLTSSLPTDKSQFFVFDSQNEPLFTVGMESEKYLKQVLSRKNQIMPMWLPTSASIYAMQSEYTGWRYVIRIPKTGAFSLFSPIGLIYALVIVVYCIGVSVYLFRLLTKPYEFIGSLIRQMKLSLGDSAETLNTDEFLMLRTHFLKLSQNLEEMRQQMDTYRFAMCNQLICDLLYPGRIASYREHAEKLLQAGLNFYTGCYCVVVLQQMDEGEKRLTAADMLETLTALRDDWVQTLCTQGEEQNIVLILTGSRDFDDKQAQSYTRTYLEHAGVQKELLICAGVGSVCDQCEQIAESYRLAKIALKDALMHQMPGIVDCQYVRSHARHEVSLQKVHGEIQQILDITREGYAEKLEDMLRELYDKMGEYNFSRVMVDAVNSELVYRGVEVGTRFEAGTETLQQEYPYGVLFALEQAYSRRECMSILHTYFILLYRAVMEKKKAAGSSKLSRRVVEYIDQSYTNPEFSASLLEQEFGVTAAHISRIFKEYTGMTVQNYLTRLRINRAKELLTGVERLSMQQIAEHVGYGNLQTFMRAFKKEMGMSPGAYRQHSSVPTRNESNQEE